MWSTHLGIFLLSYNRWYIYYSKGCAVAQAVSRWIPTAAARVRVRAGMGGLWWTKRHWDRFPPSTSVFPANYHSTNFSIIIIAQSWHHRPVGGRSAEWTHLDSTPHYTSIKKNIHIFPRSTQLQTEMSTRNL
jgi:hypothetical protein